MLRYMLVLAMLLTMISDVWTKETPDWPQFRGPGSRGVAEGKGLPFIWNTTKNVKWCVPVPGRGWSSPIVWEDKIFLS